MKYTLAMTAAALLFTGSAQVIAAPMQPTPAAMRLKGPNPAPPSDAKTFRTSFGGGFIDAAGKKYDVAGSGDLVTSTGQIRYSVTLSGYPLNPPPMDIIYFGTMSGLGIFEDGHFDIHGVPGSKGYILDITGEVAHGRIEGRFRLYGNGGSGQGDFTGL